jgi:hypothetical protein
MDCRFLDVEAIADKRPVPNLYLIPEVEGKVFVQDLTRDGEHLRQWMFERFVERMMERTVYESSYIDHRTSWRG